MRVSFSERQKNMQPAAANKVETDLTFGEKNNVAAGKLVVRLAA